jgi:hypothetical protein
LPSIGIHDLVAVIQANSREELGFLEFFEGAGGASGSIPPFAMRVLKKNVSFHATQLSQL